MSYEYFYPGTPYSLDSNYGSSDGTFTGYNMPLSGLGTTTDARTANQIAEISTKLNSGIKVAELSASDPTLLDSIPKQQFKEINRLMQLTGGEMTVHGPQIEASGYTKDGWSEAERKQAETQMKSAIERAHELNSKGNIPVTFHSTAMLPEGEEKMKVGGEIKPKTLLYVEPRTGQIGQLKETEKFFPGEPKEFDPKKELEKRNRDAWIDNIGQINFSAYRGTQILDEVEKIPQRHVKELTSNQAGEIMEKVYDDYAKSRKNPEKAEQIYKDFGEAMKKRYGEADGKAIEKIKDSHEQIYRELDHSAIFLREGYKGMKELYNMVYKGANEEDRKKLNEYAKEITPFVEKGMDRDPESLKKFSEIVEKGIRVLNSVSAPTIYKPLNEFVTEKSSETFANVALDGYKKFGDTAPIISIENPPAGGGLSRAEDLKKLIEETRKKFVENAAKQGISKSEAEKAAERIIGATWDVGHINMIRKYGYDKADVVKETEKIAPFVKHVHLSDNFGMEHTELPMGMGNVPIKDIMEKLGKQGFEGKKIIEAFQWWQHMKTPPLVPTLEAFGSPLYPMLAQPGWNQAANTYGNYFQFPSAYFPEQHFSLYGSGFSGLPSELGGQIPGKQSRMTGTPME